MRCHLRTSRLVPTFARGLPARKNHACSTPALLSLFVLRARLTLPSRKKVESWDNHTEHRLDFLRDACPAAVTTTSSQLRVCCSPHPAPAAAVCVREHFTLRSPADMSRCVAPVWIYLICAPSCVQWMDNPFGVLERAGTCRVGCKVAFVSKRGAFLPLGASWRLKPSTWREHSHHNIAASTYTAVSF